MTTATPPRANARASKPVKADRLTKDEKKLARVRRATASTKMETDAVVKLAETLREVLAELPADPKGKPARKVKLKLSDGEARITVVFEVSAKTRRK